MYYKKIIFLCFIVATMLFIIHGNNFIMPVKAAPAADAVLVTKCQYQVNDLIVRFIVDTKYDKRYWSLAAGTDKSITADACAGLICMNTITFGTYPSTADSHTNVNVLNALDQTGVDALFSNTCPGSIYNVYDEDLSRTSAAGPIELAYFTFSTQQPTDGSKYTEFPKVQVTDTETGTPTDPTTGEPINCNDFITNDGANLISELFNIIMVIGPILALVLGGADFAKATLASDESALKKAGTNFSKRIIAAILLFLLPLIINLILGLAFNAGVFGTMENVPSVCLQNK